MGSCVGSEEAPSRGLLLAPTTRPCGSERMAQKSDLLQAHYPVTAPRSWRVPVRVPVCLAAGACREPPAQLPKLSRLAPGPGAREHLGHTRQLCLGIFTLGRAFHPRERQIT